MALTAARVSSIVASVLRMITERASCMTALIAASVSAAAASPSSALPALWAGAFAPDQHLSSLPGCAQIRRRTDDRARRLR